MLLPIVLLLASAASMQQVDAGAATAKQISASDHTQAVDEGNSAQPFVRKRQRHTLDEGIIVRHRPCRSDQECNTGCLSITAYVFSDGENPELKYVTDCPNLDVPYQNKRAQEKGAGNDHQPTLKRTN